MIRMTVSADHTTFTRGLVAEADKLARMARRAVNELAWRGVEAIRDDMRRKFSRPTQYIQQGMTVVVARGMEDTATVAWKEPRSASGGPGAGRVLRAQIEGGPRRDKRMERALRGIGVPAGLVAVPGPHAPLNADGDVRGATIRAILAELRQFGPRYRARYFVVRGVKKRRENPARHL